jgi:short-subunit dehydrogenase
VELARKKHSLLLIASDSRDLSALASDLMLRFEVNVATLAIDLAAEPNPGARVVEALADLPPPTALLLPVGMSRSDDDFSLGVNAIGQILAINLHAPLAIIHAVLPKLLEAHGSIVGFGSIAAARGRGKNVVYAAAKRGLETFFESLRQRHESSGLHVQFHRLGFMRSNLTFGMRLPLPAAEPEIVASRVVRSLGHGSFSRYEPHWWGVIALVIRCLPWSLFRRMKD